MKSQNDPDNCFRTHNEIREIEYIASFLCEGEPDDIAKDVLLRNKFDRANAYYNSPAKLKERSEARASYRTGPKQTPQPEFADQQTPIVDDASGTPPHVFPSPVLPGCDARDGTPSTRPLSDLGNAYRLWDKYGANLRFVPETGEWLVWNGSSWKCDAGRARLTTLAAGLSNLIYMEGKNDSVNGIHYIRWARKSQQAHVIGSSIPLLSNFAQIRLALSHIDADPYLIGIHDGQQVIDLRTGLVRASVQSDYVTKSMNISHVGDPQKAKRFKAFLLEIFGNDAELIDWLQRWCGYLLTGLTVEQIFLFFFGLGANGKSVFAELLKYCLGDYARAIASETLSDGRRQAGAASPDLAALKSARLGVTTEIEEGSAMAESLVKSLVSGDSMSVRQVYCPPIDFVPCVKLLFLGNHKPHLKGTDHGIWRRARMVPFTQTFSRDRDPYLLDTLKAEAPHIAAWMIQGCLKWQKKGLSDVPASVKLATEEYQAEQDLIGLWLDGRCQRYASAETSTTDLYADYRPWAIDNGLRPLSSVSFGRRLAEHGFTVRKSNGKNLWWGLALNDVRDYGQIRS
jgi:P4 family phage/plasmid primase-like protien